MSPSEVLKGADKEKDRRIDRKQQSWRLKPQGAPPRLLKAVLCDSCLVVRGDAPGVTGTAGRCTIPLANRHSYQCRLSPRLGLVLGTARLSLKRVAPHCCRPANLIPAWACACWLLNGNRQPLPRRHRDWVPVEKSLI